MIYIVYRISIYIFPSIIMYEVFNMKTESQEDLIDSLLDSGEISPREAAFLRGYQASKEDHGLPIYNHIDRRLK